MHHTPVVSWRIVAVCLGTALAAVGFAQPTIQAKRAGARAPVIDGEVVLDTVWSSAVTATEFKLLGRGEALATQTTEARVLFDDRALYVAFICREDQMGELVTQIEVFDGATWEDDCVEVFIAPYPGRPTNYHFVVNAAGVLRDEMDRDEKWNSGARVAAKRGETSWSVELAIPLASLRPDETVTSTWRMNFCREEKPHGEVSSWAPCQSGFHEPDSFGQVTGLEVDLAPLIVVGLRSRIQSAVGALQEMRESAEQYRNMEMGRVVMGACSRSIDELTGVNKALTPRADMTRVRELGRTVAEAEAEIALLEARVARLPLLKAAGRRGYAVCAESTMVKVRPDKPYAGTPARSMSVSLARNEYEAAQLVVVPLEETLRGVVVSVTDLKGPRRATLPAADVNVVGYVRVEQKSGGATLEPGLLPDPLLPHEPTNVDRSRVQSWWITVHAGEDQPAGIYRGQIVVRPENAPETRIPFRARVWGFALPKVSRLRSSYGINLGYVYGKYDIAAGPGRPPGWTAGAWTGADTEGVANYFGHMKYELAFDYEVKHEGKRSCRVDVLKVEKGTREWPRFCYYTEPLDLAPATDYELTVWYRTGATDESGPFGYFGAAGAVTWPPTQGAWREGTYAFNSGDKQGIRVYLKVEKVGTVWFDSVRLAPKGAGAEVNLLPNPGFETGDEHARERIRDAYYLDALRHRASPTSLVGPKITTDDEGEPSIDWTEFDEKMQLYVDNGLSAFNVFWCQLPSGWGTVEAVEDEARIARARELLGQTEIHLDEKGWTDLAYIYTIDEPGAQAFPQVKQAFELAHSAAPKLKTLLTYGYGASRPIEPGAPQYADLAGYVDIHVPHSDCYEPIYLKAREAAGDEIWAYVCISAQRPYLNCWGIDYPGMDHRLLFWQLFDYDITGFLYWQITYWKEDPWENTLTYPGGNGDGSLIYCGPEGPVDSIRFELCRDGTEDYDMLVMLREAAEALADRGIKVSVERHLEFPHLTKSWTEYGEDPAALEAHRLRVGNRLAALTRMLRRQSAH